MITAKKDGTFDVQPMTDGQPTGDPVPADSIDTAMQSAQDALNPTGGDQRSADDTGALPAEGSADESAGDATGASTDEAALDDAKAKYAQKRGTRPKTAPSWEDYANGGNPMAK
jgi:hypothetical protein